jgi:quinol-cytochrome oxidoreductase complex cytochrome b subunit
MPGMKELTNLYIETKARLEAARGPPKKQKAVEGITLGDELIRDGAIIAFMTGTIFLLISIVPPPLHQAYDATDPPRYVKPDWYLLWSLGPIFLAKWPIMNPGIPFLDDVLIDTKFLGTIFVNAAFIALIVIPFVGKGKARRPIESPMNAAMGVFGLALIWWLSVVGIADIIFAYEIQPFHGRLHWFIESQRIPDPSPLIDWLGIVSLQQTLLCTFLTYWFFARHRPKYESKLNATYFKVR